MSGAMISPIWFYSATEVLTVGGRQRAYSIRDLTRDAAICAAQSKGNPTEMATAYIAIRAAHDALEKEMEALSKVVERIKTETLPQLFEDHDTKNVTVEVNRQNFRVSLSSRTGASIKEGHKDAAYEWLNANGLSEIIVETVNASTLAAAVGEMIKERNLEPPVEHFNVVRMPTTSVTLVKEKK